jgi:hypothetical protein
MVLSHLYLESRPKNDCPFLISQTWGKQTGESIRVSYLFAFWVFPRVVKANVVSLIN